MMRFKNLLIIKLILFINLSISQLSFADNHNIYEILELIQKDIKTLEKAVYSGSIELNDNTFSSSNQNNNSVFSLWFYKNHYYAHQL